MISSDIIIIAVVGFFSGLIKTGVGVGAGLFLLPTLALAFPAKTALGLGAPLMLVSDIIGLRYYWKQWLPRVELTRLFLAALPGLILGVLVLPLIPGAIFRTGVGVFGVLYALGLLWPRFPVAALLKKLFGGLTARHADKGAYIYGFLGGVATVLAHAGGLVWSLYLITAARDRRIFVGATIILFFVTNTCKTISYVCIDILGPDGLLKVIPAIPMILLGSYFGNIINKKCNYLLFRKIVLCFIFLTSISLCR
ncbi:sulfite exporter TauE/SafE family protein [Desulfovibrio sp. PG-178-WT-4]|uniref:Probable membrane transporter protein n=1 Tax=Desulfovibrio porci TaxID=2605782 RepID=A0A6L5XMK8_9BACT|nr:sulfite exporter TauE/SafE family protein [Desulfovibrio porci]MSS28514.1 sulfite exporter TauE/SafE family protein [Desulfovibrio porci]